MADIFHEIEEDVRREQFKKLWARYGKYVSGAVVALVLGVGAYVWQKQQTEARAAQAGVQFAAASALAQEGKHDEAYQAFEAIAASSPVGYRALAGLRAAAAKQASGDAAGALAIYDGLVRDQEIDPLLRDYARLLAAWRAVDLAAPADVKQRLQPLLTPTGPWRHLARELAAAADLKAGDVAAARDAYRGLADDATAPAGVRGRAAELIAALAPPG